MKTAAHVLLIVGGAVALIPFLGWAGGILAIIGGALYLTSLKNFKQANS
ncbi:prophage Lp1 protein 6 [Agrilactobacillus composti DSM 18527 = JCM 14202]|nr:prophage Lp1 protein 6 [Agrilactobacillus composti DSM 18527 = JCM 14202]